MRSLAVVGLCAIMLLQLASTSLASSSDDDLFINSLYPPSANTAGRARPNLKSGPHGIPIERTTFKLKEASFCPRDNRDNYFGYWGVWTSRLTCPASADRHGNRNQQFLFGANIIGRCHIQITDDRYYDLELPTPDPNVAIYATFTANCNLKGGAECGPNCDLVGTVVGTVYEVYESYTPDGVDPSRNLPPKFCDAYNFAKIGKKESTPLPDDKPARRKREHRPEEPASDEAKPQSIGSHADTEYYKPHSTPPLNETVYTGEALIFSGYMNVATLQGDVLPALGGWFEYTSANSETYWEPIASANLPSTARAVVPYEYKFQLWKPVSEYDYQRQ